MTSSTKKSKQTESTQGSHVSEFGWKASKIVAGICLLLTISELFIHRHAYSDAEAMPLFYGLFGFIAFIVVVIGGILLREVIMRPEDYYDAD
jgi:hypothetical protein